MEKEKVTTKQAELREIFGGSKKMKKTLDKRDQSEDKLETVIEMIQGRKREIRENLRVMYQGGQKQYKREMKELKEDNEKLKKEKKRWTAWIRKKDVIMLSFRRYAKNAHVLKRMKCRTF
jgi:molybdopterin converting factor small subunit